MTDSTDKQANEKLNQTSRHESLHSRLDSIDKKLKEKHDNPDDLDAMLDEAESSLSPINEPIDDEDAIDRLLMNAGFDVDDDLVQEDLRQHEQVAKDADFHDDLDIFLGFDGFGEDLNDQEAIQSPEKKTTDANIGQQDDDALDRLLMNTTLDADDAILEEEPDLFEKLENESPTNDEIDDFFGLADSFEEPDLDLSSDQNDSEIPAPSDAASSVGDDDFPDIGLIDDQFDESGSMTDNDLDANDTSRPVEEKSDEFLSDELDNFPEFDESDLISDTTPTLSTPNEEPQTEQSFDDDLFDESDLISDDTLPELAATEEKPQPVDEQPSDDDILDELNELVDDSSGISDEIDDFSSVDEGFDISELIQDETLEADSSASDQQDQGLVGDISDDDNLFLDSAFDEEDKEEQKPVEIDEFGDDADDFFQLDEISDDFSQTVAKPQEESKAQADREDDFLLPDFDITADIEPSDKTSGQNNDVAIDGGIANNFSGTSVPAVDPIMPPLPPEANNPIEETKQTFAAENIETRSSGIDKKQLEEAENKAKKAKVFAYVSLGFGVVALSAATGLGYMTYKAKKDVSALTETVTTLEANLAKSAANSPSEEIDVMRNSVVQLNQQFDGFITELKGTPEFPMDLLNDKLPGITAKQYLVSKALDMLQVKMGDLEEKASTVPVIREPAKIEAVHEALPAKVETPHEVAPIKEPTKEAAPHEHVHEHLADKAEVAHTVPTPAKEEVHETAPTKERALHETENAKVEPAPIKVKIPPKPVIDVKPVAPVKPVIKHEAKPQPKPEPKPEPVEKKTLEAPAGKWGINLVAVNHEWYAKSQAAKFARQGVYAEVIPIQSNNTTMYRLRVTGFKTKKEADANTARIKKALNLNSVWVSDN